MVVFHFRKKIEPLINFGTLGIFELQTCQFSNFMDKSTWASSFVLFDSRFLAHLLTFNRLYNQTLHVQSPYDVTFDLQVAQTSAAALAC